MIRLCDLRHGKICALWDTGYILRIVMDCQGVRAKRGTKHDSTGVWLRGLGE